MMNDDKLHIALCDDDHTALESESQLLHTIFDQRAIDYELEVFNSPKMLLTKIADYDMLFLDIEMSEISGIDIARTVMEKTKNCYVFFLTNYSVYLDKALDVNALRYLTKPIDAARLASGIDTALNRISMKSKTVSITVLDSRRQLDIKISDIVFVSNSGRHAKITTKTGCFETSENFSLIKKRIEDEVNYFAMPHQSFFVNLNYVISHNRNRVIISCADNQYKIDISRRQFNNFDKQMFELANNLR